MSTVLGRENRPDFVPMPKIPRLHRDIVITEKIDGTNAGIMITPEGEIYASSRNRWITPEDDNYGFARWVQDNQADLMKLGPGMHFGEWWGQGIQRGYGQDRKHFSLFNAHRWADPEERPECCLVVPVLQDVAVFSQIVINRVYQMLRMYGSKAAPGYMNPEGVVVFHRASGQLFKWTYDDNHKEKQ